MTGISEVEFWKKRDYGEEADQEKTPVNLKSNGKGRTAPWMGYVSIAATERGISVGRSDEDLMLSIKNGDSFAFEILTKRHYANTLNFIYRFVNNQTLAEDLCQETFLRLWRSTKTYQPLAKLTTFLYHIAKNVCLKYLAKMGRLPYILSLDEPVYDEHQSEYTRSEEIEDNRYLPEEKVISKETGEAIRSAINKLSEEHRLVFILTEFQGLSYQEVAEISQCPIGTVASRKNAAVRHLQKNLAQYSSY